MKSKITLLIISFIFAFGTSNAQTTVLSEDFEGGTLGNFTGGIPTGTLNWNLTQIRGGDPGHSATSSAYFGNPIDTSYDTGAIEGGELTSGAIDLSAYASATLSFNYFLETEAFAPYDIAQALVSTDGVTFVAVATNQAGNLVDPSGTWQPVTIDISAYAGFATVYIRFDFNTVDDVANAFEGFYVDDVTVVASTFACNLIANASSTDETTAGANDGTGTAIATGGTPPYTYLWSDPASQTTATAIGLAPGTYTVTITDANSCIATATITIQPAGVGCTLVVTATSTDETTAGANDGTGTATATGGLTPYFYMWDDPAGQTTATATGLAPGTYTVTVVALDSCTATATITVLPGGVGCTLVVTTTSTDETTAGANDGTGTAIASGGLTPYFYLWDDSASQTTPTAIGLAPGTYIVTVTDAAGCVAVGTVVILPGGVGCTLVVTTTSTDESLPGFNDGTALAIVSGGTGPYTYLWAPGGQTTQTIAGLSPGTYTVTVIDAMGCQAVGTVIIQPAGCNLVVTATSTDETSAGANDGTATVVATGGTPPYFYLWSDPSGQTTAVAIGLSPGTYTVTVTDAGGCLAVATVFIQAGGGCTGPIANFSFTTSGLSASFSDGSTVLTPAFYTWNFGDGNTSTGTGMISASNTYLTAGTYNVCLTVSDSCGMDVVCQMITVSDSGSCNLTVATTSTDETWAGMNDGTGTAFATGGTVPYNYLWSDGQITATASGLAPGVYTVTVTDASGCFASSTITVLPGAVLCQIQIAIAVTDETSPGANDGTAMANVTNGTPPYAYLWSNGATTSSISGLAPGVYSCTVLDADGCTTAGTGVVQAFLCSVSGSTSSTDESSLGAFDGTATITGSGGTPPYNYIWDNFQTTSTITGLTSGVYGVTVTDANLCTYSTSVAVNIAGCNLTATVTGTDETQAGANDGSATVTVSGAAPPYVINWSNFEITPTISNLPPGNYTVTVIDSLACYATATYTVVPGQIVGIFEQPDPVITLNVYPNPAMDMINFEITGADRGILYIFDFAGRQVNQFTINQSVTEINTTALRNGMYFYQLIGTGSEKLGSGKFVIHR